MTWRESQGVVTCLLELSFSLLLALHLTLTPRHDLDFG